MFRAINCLSIFITILLVSTWGSSTAVSGTLGCADWMSVSTPAGRLSNNVWNKQATGGLPYRQCLEQRTVGGNIQYGWSWSWPVSGNTVYAYPEIIVGSKPWEGPGTDSRFPRSIANTPQLYVSYETEISATGSYNLSTSIWLIDTPYVASPPDTSAIKVELMIWTETVPDTIIPGGTKRGEVRIDGYFWEVYASEDWGDDSGQNPNTWTNIAYRNKSQTRAITYDAMKMIADAESRGLISPNLYIADVELGNEIKRGSGNTWLKSFSVTLHPPPIIIQPPPPVITGPLHNLLLKN